jgi:hypothetical protein
MDGLTFQVVEIKAELSHRRRDRLTMSEERGGRGLTFTPKLISKQGTVGASQQLTLLGIRAAPE